MREANKKDITLSIIIPCFNCEHTIIRCLNSLNINKNIQIILIDDCSTDATYSMIKKYMILNLSYDIKIIKNSKNIGAGESRNIGLSYAINEYIMFVDADDEIEADFYYNINELSNWSNYDCIIFNAKYKKRGRRKLINMFFTNKVCEGEVDKKIALVYVKGCTCGKIYKKSLIQQNNIYFGNTPINEDLVFTKCAISCANKVLYIKKYMYIYNISDGSLMNIARSYNYEIEAYKSIKMYLSNKEFDLELNSIFFLEVIYSILKNSIVNKDSYKQTKKKFNNSLKYYNKRDKYRHKYRWQYQLFYYIALIIYGDFFNNNI